jgi:Peptidase A4 family
MAYNVKSLRTLLKATALVLPLAAVPLQHVNAQAFPSFGTEQRPIISVTPPEDTVCQHCATPSAEVALAPPVNFDAVSATDAQLDLYGFPPRPDAKKSPEAYATWKMVFSHQTARIVPQLRATNVYNVPAQITSDTAGRRNAPNGTTSNNWSGYVISDSADPFAAPKSYIFAGFVVPFAQQAAGTCSSKWVYASEWVGLDGSGSSDVLQAGVDTDAKCSKGKTIGNYDVWYEWFPNSEVVIKNFAVYPGDVVFVYVWSTSHTEGHYFIANLTSGKSSTLAFKAPKGTELKGNSAEWIVERPTIGGKLATLPNYTSDPWYLCHVLVPGGEIYSPAAPQGGTSHSFTMQDGNDDISYADTTPNDGLTYVNPKGNTLYYAGTGLWFFPEGSAVKK